MSTFKSACDIDKKKKKNTTNITSPYLEKDTQKKDSRQELAKATLSFGIGKHDVATCMA